MHSMNMYVCELWIHEHMSAIDERDRIPWELIGLNPGIIVVSPKRNCRSLSGTLYTLHHQACILTCSPLRPALPALETHWNTCE